MANSREYHLYRCTDFETNQQLIGSLLSYIEPPHEPLPIIEGLPAEAADFLATGEGLQITVNWARSFQRSISLLQEYDPAITNDRPEIVFNQQSVLNCLARRLVNPGY